MIKTKKSIIIIYINFLKTLNSYFSKDGYGFKYQLKLIGSTFQKKVWYEISKIMWTNNYL